MDKTAMVKHLFLIEKERAGQALVRLLDQASLDVRGAFWLYDSENNRWRLYLAIKQVDSLGPKRVYTKVQSVARRIPEIVPTEVSIVSPQHPTVRLLRNVIQTGRELTSVQLSDNVVNGELIADAFVYRMM